MLSTCTSELSSERFGRAVCVACCMGPVVLLDSLVLGSQPPELHATIGCLQPLTKPVAHLQDLAKLKPYVMLAYDQYGSYGPTDALNDNIFGNLARFLVGGADGSDMADPNLILARKIKDGVCTRQAAALPFEHELTCVC